ncbi:predicted protein [Chaetomium globosum CBS 148.51]|uniref:Uncharacterized protein n=1 Tax=Chaetomium globosum (strain ATCC 6205 / CBS 148.51 / DSM 1962 / NBRC 6347 / NRRL 1970) TaxID=306901 RepID=Q2GX78_CHAGB|nr:uncharacterized protein CHGG_07426 [Chaetomium globosum CBS 148.51]EAQ86173.1 predicted protein [Chaetomium globosum CBS 148.51]
MSREDHSTIRTMDSASFLGIGSWEQGVQIVATDDCEIMLPTPALLAWTVLGRENSWNWFSAYPDPWSPLGVHHQSDHDWIGSRENSDFNGEDSDTNSSWSCSYLVPAARE